MDRILTEVPEMKLFPTSRIFVLFLLVNSVSAEPNEARSPAPSVEKVVEARSLAWIRTAIERDIPAFLSFASDDCANVGRASS